MGQTCYLGMWHKKEQRFENEGPAERGGRHRVECILKGHLLYESPKRLQKHGPAPSSSKSVSEHKFTHGLSHVYVCWRGPGMEVLTPHSRPETQPGVQQSWVFWHLLPAHDGEAQGTAVGAVSCRLSLGEELGRGVEEGGSAPKWVQCLHDGRWGVPRGRGCRGCGSSRHLLSCRGRCSLCFAQGLFYFGPRQS